MSDTGWHTDDHPELRAGPPWVMEEMVAAEPELAEAMLAGPLPVTGEAAHEIEGALAAGRPVTVTGCGTSEHAAHGVAALVAGAVGSARAGLVHARPAFGAALDAADGLCLAVSHEGGTRATLLAVEAAARQGARTAAITHDPASPIAQACDHVLVTPRHDDSWCHTVGYISPLLAGAAIAGGLGRPAARPAVARDTLQAAIALPAAPLAARLADRRVVLCAGAGIDHITARELALKLAEGARLPAVALELETVLHGQLAGHEPSDGLVLVAIDDHPRVARRAEHVARAAAAIGIPVAALLSAGHDRALAAELTPAGRLVVALPDAAAPDHRLAVLLAGAGALQALTLALVHARGTNPDLIRREVGAYREAATVAEGDGSW